MEKNNQNFWFQETGNWRNFRNEPEIESSESQEARPVEVGLGIDDGARRKTGFLEDQFVQHNFKLHYCCNTDLLVLQ